MEKNITIRWSEEALNELEKTYFKSIELFGKSQTVLYIDELINKISDLPLNPNIHPVCKYLNSKNGLYRNIIYPPFLVIYKFNSETIDILGLFHTAQMPEKVKLLRKRKAK